MSGYFDSAEAAILDKTFDGSIWTGTMAIGLSSTTPAEGGTNITEPSGGSYARATTVNGDWAAAVAGAPTTKANGTAIAFATATADWVSAANLTHWVLYINNVARFFGALTTPKPVLSGDTPSFPIGSLVLKLGDPGDSGL